MFLEESLARKKGLFFFLVGKKKVVVWQVISKKYRSFWSFVLFCKNNCVAFGDFHPKLKILQNHWSHVWIYSTLITKFLKRVSNFPFFIKIFLLQIESIFITVISFSFKKFKSHKNIKVERKVGFKTMVAKSQSGASPIENSHRWSRGRLIFGEQNVKILLK